MFKPIPLFIGLRYMRSRKKNHFVSFISLSSMLGITLGVMVLITVLSVMNGFDVEIHKRFFGMAPEITVTGVNDQPIQDWQNIEQKIKQFSEVKSVSPFIGSQGLMTYQGEISPIAIMGILPEQENTVTHLQEKLLLGSLNLEHFGVVVGRTLAEHMGLMLGDQVTLMIPEAGVTPAGMIPRFKRFRVVGIFSAGTGFGFENKLAFIHLTDAQKFLHMSEAVSGFKLKINHIYDAPVLSEKINAALGMAYHVGNWTSDFGAFFQAVKMEKTMMFLILILIIAVAAFNLVSSLVMMVNDKQAEIAILRTIGASPRCILSIFMIQGMLVGGIGTLLGLLFGVLLAYFAPDIVAWIQSYWEISILSSNIYWVDYLPSQIMGMDLLKVCVTALLMSFIATIYPAWRASNTVIVEALHHE